MSEYTTDVSRFTANVSEPAVKAIVDYCGIALRNRDSAMVSASDPQELARVREGFAAKKLGLTPEAAEAGMKSVIEKMHADRTKQRVTFYYLLAEATGTLAKLGTK